MDPERVGTGNALVVIASGAGSVSARIEFRGATYPLVPRGEAFWGVLGIPVEAEPGEEPLRATFHDADGNEIGDAAGSYVVVAIERPVEQITLTPEVASTLTADTSQREAELRAEQFARSDPEPAWSEPLLGPLTRAPITAPFGTGRSYNGAPVSSYHRGVDYAGPAGDPVLASAPGRVSWVGEMPIRGNSVIVDHGAGLMTGYHHLSRIDVAVDDLVQAGTQLGALGATGLTTGPHVHWEVIVLGVNVDPLPWLFNSFLNSGSLGAPAQTESAQE